MYEAIVHLNSAEQDAIENDKRLNIRARILHMLRIYPVLSPSHIQQGMGILPGVWKPVLETLIDAGEVKRTHEVHETPTGRQQTHTLLEIVK